MQCPACKSRVILGEGKRAYQTLDEHVCDPNGDVDEKEYYICSNHECELRNRIFWDFYGDVYSISNDFMEIQSKYKILYPIGSPRLKSHVENDKHDEDFTLLNLYFVRFRITYKYTANENGDILSRKAKLETSVRRKGTGWSLYISPIKMFKFSIEWFEMVANRYRNNPNNKTVCRELVREFDQLHEGKRLYKRVAAIVVAKKYGNTIKMIKLEELFSK